MCFLVPAPPASSKSFDTVRSQQPTSKYSVLACVRVCVTYVSAPRLDLSFPHLRSEDTTRLQEVAFTGSVGAIRTDAFRNSGIVELTFLSGVCCLCRVPSQPTVIASLPVQPRLKNVSPVACSYVYICLLFRRLPRHIRVSFGRRLTTPAHVHFPLHLRSHCVVQTSARLEGLHSLGVPGLRLHRSQGTSGL